MNMRHVPDLKSERGIALAMAIFALVVIGAIVAGTVFAGRLEQSGGQNTIYAGQAFAAADAGLASTVAGWSKAFNQLADHDSLAVTETSLGGNAYTSGEVVRVNDLTFLVRSVGETRTSSGNVLATRMLGQLVKLNPTDVDIQAAVTARGTVTVGGNARVDGHDQDPSGWASCGSLTDLAGIRTNDTVQVSGSATLNGSPPQTPWDSTITDSMFAKPFDDLAANADISLGAGSYNGMVPSYTVSTPVKCNKASTVNWGEPWMGTSFPLCTDYFPIIYRNGDLDLQNGRGQGVLLVRGNLRIRGNVAFTGLIIALGQVESRGTGNKISGALLASNAELGDETTFIGNPVVTYSSCAVSKALQASAKVIPLASRSWAQLY
jgi:Tfp pilus assembly protein PilX